MSTLSKYPSSRKYGATRAAAPQERPAPGAKGGPVDRGFMKPAWRKKVEKLRNEPSVVTPGGVPRRARVSRPMGFWESLLRPFEIWRAESEAVPGVERPPLEELLVPEAEREYARSRARQFQARAESRPSPYARPAYSRPGQESEGTPSYAQRPRYERPSAVPGPAPAGQAPPPSDLASLVTPAYVDQVMNVARVMEHVKAAKADPKFDGLVGIGVLAPPGMDPWGKVLKVAEFFGIPPQAYDLPDRDKVWNEIILPFLGAVERQLNVVRPAELTGRFQFGTSQNGSFGLVYTEKA